MSYLLSFMAYLLVLSSSLPLEGKVAPLAGSDEV
jgi:hypothetical protein